MLATASIENTVDHARLIETTGLASRDLTLLLQKLQRWKLIERVGQGRGCVYRLGASVGRRPVTPGSPPVVPLVQSRSSEHLPPSSERTAATIARSSEHLALSSEHLGEIIAGSSDHLAESSDHLDRLMEWARPIREAKKVPREKLESAILEASAQCYRSMKDLVRILGRAEITLRSHYLTRMVADGRLELRFPKTPNHPQQAYRSATPSSPGKDQA